jgi:hypothetical protein
MAISRKAALERLESLLPRVEEHITKILANPGHSSIAHWKHEARNWLREMEEVLPHVGKKTAAQWKARLESLQAALGD